LITITANGGSSTSRYTFHGNSPSITLTTCASGTCSAFTATYWEQFRLVLSYSIIGGGSPSAPIFSANQDGTTFGQTLTTSPAAYWFDAGGSWSVTNPLGGSSSTQRWALSQSSTGSDIDPSTMVFVYHHQYLITASFTSVGGAPPTGSVVLTGTQFGHTVHTTLSTTPTTVWLDAGTTWSVPTSFNSGGHTWTASGTTSGTVSAATTVKPTYTRH